MYRDESESLRHQVITLRKENKALKALLTDNAISFAEVIANINLYVDKEEYDSNQAGRIIHPDQITD